MDATTRAAADGILRRLTTAPTTDFIYSSLSFFGRRWGGEIGGTWFVQALGELGVAAPAIRQALFRMEREGALSSRRVGRAKFYAPAGATPTILQAGGKRIREQSEAPWDGAWTVVTIPRGTIKRRERQLLRDVLLVHGFARFRPGVYLHPRDHSAAVLDAIAPLSLRSKVIVFRGPLLGGKDGAAIVRELWDIQAIAQRYRAFVRRFTPIVAQDPTEWTPRDAFGIRFAYMFELFRISWDDPALPSAVLPDDWQGGAARDIARTLGAALQSAALEFGEQIAAVAVTR